MHVIIQVLVSNHLHMRLHRFSGGYTLIEILVTITILVAFSALSAAMLSITNLTRLARHQDIALKVANNALEDMRGRGYNNLAASSSLYDSLLSSLPGGVASSTVTSFNTLTKSVQVTVAWREGSAATTSVSLSTLITQTGGLP